MAVARTQSASSDIFGLTKKGDIVKDVKSASLFDETQGKPKE